MRMGPQWFPIVYDMPGGVCVMISGGPPASIRVTYSRQSRRCNKPDCPSCALGAPGHGPYWYAYWREGRRLRSRYVGKALPPGIDSAATEDPSGSSASGSGAPSPSLRVRTLGGFEVQVGDLAVSSRRLAHRGKVSALFKCLISARSLRVHREHAIEVLWPNADPLNGAKNLRLTVHRLRRAFEEMAVADGFMRVEGAMLVLAPVLAGEAPADWLDAAAFDRAAIDALSKHDPASCTTALSLYRGDYLPEDLYDEWAVTRREELRQRYLALLLHLAAIREQQGALSGAARCMRDVLALDPYHEPATRALMRMQALAGRHAEAIRTYRRLADTLSQDLRLAPDIQTQDLYRTITAGTRHIASASQRAMDTVSVPTGLLPVQPRLQVLESLHQRRCEGRAAELAELQRRLAQVAAGHGQLVVLHGATGVGKSRLLAEQLRDALEGGALVLLGHAYRQERQLPYGPLQDALRGYVIEQPPALLSAQIAYHSVLVRLVPELARRLSDLLPPAPIEPRVERHRLFAALSGLLQELGRSMPVVLALEDLQWADPITLQAIHYLQRTCRSARVLIICTCRTVKVPADESAAGLAGVLQGLSPASVVEVLPLDRAESAKLVTELLTPASVDPAVVEILVSRAGGNPLFLTELVASMQETQRLVLRGNCWHLAPNSVAGAPLPVPARIQSSVVDHVRSIGETAVPVLRQCAVFGHAFPLKLLCLASGLHEDTLLDVLGAAVEADLLEEHAGGEQPAYRFRHDLIRDALYQSMPGSRRQLLHRRADEALVALNRTPAAESDCRSWLPTLMHDTAI
jgi:DNA-binding SARP family transcriptional activator